MLAWNRSLNTVLGTLRMGGVKEAGNYYYTWLFVNRRRLATHLVVSTALPTRVYMSAMPLNDTEL
jgi:hypothetical protein